MPAPLKVLVAHNRYRLPGGEDTVFESEVALLRKFGLEVLTYEVSNAERDLRLLATGGLAANWNGRAYKHVFDLVRAHHITVCHFHNIFPRLSPSVYVAARKAGSAVVQTLHNYRAMCANGLLFRRSEPCESCVGRALPWPALFHRCYRNSALTTFPVVAYQTVQHSLGAWRRFVNRFIALTQFSADAYIRAGFPSHKLSIKPNCLPERMETAAPDGRYFLYLGRLSPEKGVEVLIRAARRLGPAIPVKIVGDGPASCGLRRLAGDSPWIEFVGHVPRAKALEYIRHACCVVIPSLWYEQLPMCLIEAFACGVPVVASERGSLVSLVRNGETGVLFPPGDDFALMQLLRRLWNAPELVGSMRSQAREEFERIYSPEHNVKLLLEIYREAVRDHHSSVGQ